MEEKSVYKYFIDRVSGIYYVTVFLNEKRSTTIGRGSHSNKTVAVRLAMKNLEHNLKLAKNIEK